MCVHIWEKNLPGLSELQMQLFINLVVNTNVSVVEEKGVKIKS